MLEPINSLAKSDGATNRTNPVTASIPAAVALIRCPYVIAIPRETDVGLRIRKQARQSGKHPTGASRSEAMVDHAICER